LTAHKDFDDIVLLVDALESKSLDEACLRFAFSPKHLNRIRGIALFRVVENEFLELVSSFGEHILDLETITDIWGKNKVASSVRNQNSEFAQESHGEVGVIPLISTGLGRGVLVISSSDGNPLPATVKERFREISIVGGHLLEAVFSEKSNPTTRARGVDSAALSVRQLEVLQLVKISMTNESIARKMHVSVSTVRQDLMKIFKVLNVSDRKSAGARATELGI
jgi:DNA-binding CsgD family transcriptional regulator